MAVQDNAILRFAAHFSVPGASDVVNVYHAVMDSVGDVDEANVLADLEALVTGAMSNLSAHYPTDITLVEVKAWVRNVALGRWDYIGAISGTWAGTSVGGDNSAVAVAPLVHINTTDAHSKGTKYLPPVNDGSMDNGVWIAGLLTVLASFLSDISGVYLGTYAEYAMGLWSVASAVFKLFNGTGTLTNRPAYQRRRKAGVGT